METPDVAYARSGDVSIAYQVVGDGSLDIVFMRASTGDLVSTWDQPLLVRHVEGLARLGRVLMLDRRGSGLSDRIREVPSLETTMDDVRAVMDAAGSQRAVLWSGGQSTGLAVLFAATYPERCAGLVLFKPTVRGVRTDDYPWAPTRDEWAEQLQEIRERWGDRAYFEELAHEWAPEVADDPAFVDWFVWHLRRSLSPGAAVTSSRTTMELDVADLLSAVRVPTLVLPHPAEPGPAHYAAARIQGAEVVDLPELRGNYTWVDDDVHAATMAATAAFLGRLTTGPAERLLATILFTDIVSSTERTVAIGDAAWKELLERHHAIVRTELARHQGRELDTLGDGFFAAFESPAQGVRCARAIRDALEPLDLHIRTALHAGEFELAAGKLTGVGVVVAARILTLAEADEILVSATVRDLVAGSGLAFDDRGEHELKGIPGAWRVFALHDGAAA